MKLHFYCVMCGKEHVTEIPLERLSADLTVAQIVKSQGWIVQINGANLDVYCSKTCAA